jgi:hypothetical protein
MDVLAVSQEDALSLPRPTYRCREADRPDDGDRSGETSDMVTAGPRRAMLTP